MFYGKKSLLANDSCGFYRKYLSIDNFAYICSCVRFPFSLSIYSHFMHIAIRQPFFSPSIHDKPVDL